jgi:hypothetical protein
VKCLRGTCGWDRSDPRRQAGCAAGTPCLGRPIAGRTCRWADNTRLLRARRRRGVRCTARLRRAAGRRRAARRPSRTASRPRRLHRRKSRSRLRNGRKRLARRSRPRRF